MTRGGWPSDWDARKAGAGCHLCEQAITDDLTGSLQLPYSSVSLAPNSLLVGYCIVAFRGRHVCEIYELSETELAGYMRDVSVVAEAIAEVFTPMKINLMTLGNWVPHLHTHVVPRYIDDPRPGDPIPYEEMFGDPDPAFSHHAQLIESAIRQRACT